MTPMECLVSEGVVCRDCQTVIDSRHGEGREFCPECETSRALRGETFPGRRRVYISGGITDVPEYKKAFDFARERLRICGCIVIDPTEMHPEGSESWDWDDWLRYELPIITKYCDALFMLDGWSRSKGACTEHEHARHHQKAIFYDQWDDPDKSKPCLFCHVETFTTQ